MPSPFPGMDPYVEHPLLWPSVQQYLLGHIADVLTEVLPRRYRVSQRERCYREETNLPAAPPSAGCPLPRVRENGTYGQITSVWHIPLAPQEQREPYLDLVLASKPEAIVTTLELLSFATKTPGSLGRKLYLERQRQLLQAGVHLLEIDLLRAGTHALVAPRERILRRGGYDYLIGLTRAGQRDFSEVWGWRLPQPLPRIAIPLHGDEAPLVLDLQPLWQSCFEAGGFGRQVDYRDDPFTPLPRAQAAWADGMLVAERSG